MDVKVVITWQDLAFETILERNQTMKLYVNMTTPFKPHVTFECDWISTIPSLDYARAIVHNDGKEVTVHYPASTIIYFSTNDGAKLPSVEDVIAAGCEFITVEQEEA